MSIVSTLKKRGCLVVVEGLDRSGKTSQCQLLHDALKEKGYQVRYVKFPGTKLFRTEIERCADSHKTAPPRLA